MEEYVTQIEDFINHNISVGYLKESMTIGQLIEYLANIKTRYIPMVEQIQEKYELNQMRVW